MIWLTNPASHGTAAIFFRPGNWPQTRKNQAFFDLFGPKRPYALLYFTRPRARGTKKINAALKVASAPPLFHFEAAKQFSQAT
jgi:hypothetical protein